MSNDEVGRRGVVPATNETDLSQSSTPSLAHRRRNPAIARPIVRPAPNTHQMRLFIVLNSRTRLSHASFVASHNTDIWISEPPSGRARTARFTTAGYAGYEGGANDQTALCVSSTMIVQSRTVETVRSWRALNEASASATVRNPISEDFVSGNGPRDGNS